jgi:hypothetical protein
MSDEWEKELPNGTTVTFSMSESLFGGHIYCLKADHSLSYISHSRVLTHDEAEALFAGHLAELASRKRRKGTAD